jgi:DNA-binding CsgD family transcriptional regulator
MGLGLAKGRNTYAFDEGIDSALIEQAKARNVSAQELAENIMNEGLEQIKAGSFLLEAWEALSAREQQVCALTCLGYTNRQIAGRLGISPETIKTHIQSVLRKFNMHGKAEMQVKMKDWDFSDWEK